MRYIYNGNEYSEIPNDDLISGKRKILVSCEAKAIGAEHTLRFVVRDAEKPSWLTSDAVKVIGNDWTQYQIYLQFDPSKKSMSHDKLRIVSAERLHKKLDITCAP